MVYQKKDLITLMDYSPDEIREIILTAKNLKIKRLKDDPQVLQGCTGVLIFEKPSLRTRITFEVAINELGGYPINLTPNMVQIGKRESVEDVARNLEQWVHILVVRTFSHETVVKLARYSKIPVINALTDSFHPCQSLAFGLTLYEHTNNTKNLKIAFIGDGNNVCLSHMVLCAKLGYDFTLACPKGYEPPKQIVKACLKIAKENNSTISIVNDPSTAVVGASAIYTDVWTSMGKEDELKQRIKKFLPYQVNSNLLSYAPENALISHCLPAHRGEEITSDILDSERSIAFDEAENRLHVQKAAIVHIFS